MAGDERRAEVEAALDFVRRDIRSREASHRFAEYTAGSPCLSWPGDLSASSLRSATGEQTDHGGDQ